MASADGRRSFTGRVIDYCCLAFAAWTLLCNTVVLAQGSLVDLLRLTGLVLLVLVAGLVLRWRRGATAYGSGAIRHSPEDREHPEKKSGSAGATLNRATLNRTTLNRSNATARAVALAIGVLITLSYPMTGNFTLFWWLLTAYFAVAFLVAIRRPVNERASVPRRRLELTLVGIGVLCAAITLLAHRPDNDEIFYVNLALSATDHPGMPLLEYENIHGIPGQRINAFYRVTSVEVLVGAISYLSGISALAVSHCIVATLAGFLVPLAYGRLFRIIGGRGWIWGVVGTITFLLVDGSAHANYGNLAFVRLYQGKCIFLTLVAPCIIAYALRFAGRPTAGRWYLLSASLIAGTGLTSSAVWAGPAITALALVATWEPGRRMTATLATGASAAFYPLMVGLLLKFGAGVSSGAKASAVEPLDLAEQGFLKVFDDNLAPFSVAVLAWLLARPGLGRRFATVFPLGLALILSPYTAPWVARNLTGIWTFWRVFWLLPLPGLVGLAVIACRRLLGGTEQHRTLRLIGCVGALVLAATMLPPRYTLSRANGVEIKLPTLKMPAAYAYVEMVNRGVKPGAYVLAPPEISQWMTTQNRHAYPLLSIPKYLSARLEPAEFERRARLISYVSGRHRSGIDPEALSRGLMDYNLTGVCLDLRAPWIDEMRRTLRKKRYRKTAAQGAYEMWVLAPGPEPEESMQ